MKPNEPKSRSQLEEDRELLGLFWAENAKEDLYLKLGREAVWVENLLDAHKRVLQSENGKLVRTLKNSILNDSIKTGRTMITVTLISELLEDLLNSLTNKDE